MSKRNTPNQATRPETSGNRTIATSQNQRKASESKTPTAEKHAMCISETRKDGS